tara:strand:+ start:2378 stop:2599 length:222 start_codon:yes stop_codon:yes gene_type:complete
MTGSFEPGDLVWVVHDAASDIVRNEEIAPKGVIVSKIPDSIWYRVFMSWSEKTKITDFPVHMLKKISPGSSAG